MKRCSQCEFVYEDDQARCDMDGGELVYEPTLYPMGETALAVTTPPIKLRSRSFILTAAATAIMGLFLGIGFLGLSHRSELPTSPTPAAEPAPVAPAIVQPAMAATASEATPSTNETTTASNETTVSPAANVKSRNAAAPAAASSSAPKPAPAATGAASPIETKKSEPPKATQKEDSKVGSLLKKTGRILKKPFKW